MRTNSANGAERSNEGLQTQAQDSAERYTPGSTREPRQLRPVPASAALRHDAIFNQVAVGIAQTTTDNRILDANQHLCDMLGYSGAELRMLRTRDLTHPDDRDLHDDLRQQLIEGRIDHFSAEKRYLRKDGREIWISRTVTLARDAANEAPYLIQVIQDISARKRTEAQFERLRRAREVLASCNRVLVHASDESEMLQQMCRIAVDSGGYKQAWIGLVTGEPKRPVYPAAYAGYAQDAPPMSSAVVWTEDGRYRGKMAAVVACGESRLERDIFGDSRYAEHRPRASKFGWGSSLTLPLKSEGRVLGAFEFNAREADAFDGDEIAMLGELAADISFGIAALRTRAARQQAETQAHEHELRFRAAFEQAAVGIAHTALSGEYILVNRKLCEMLGYAEDALIGRRLIDLMRPEDRIVVERNRKAMLAGKLEQYACESRFARKDGSDIWINATVSLAHDLSGDPLYFIAVIEDISSRKELELRYQETFDQAAVGIVHTSLGGRYLKANRRFCQMLGYGEHELVGQEAADFTHPDDRDKGRDFRHLMCEGKLAKFDEVKRYLRKDGKVVWTSRTVSLARDASGKPMYFIRVIEDITERRGMEERYRATFDSAPVGIMHTRFDDHQILRANRKLAEMLGYTETELLALKSTSVVHPDCRNTDAHRYRSQLVSGEAQSFASERKYVRKDGSIIWVNRTVSLVKDASGKPDYFIRIIEDITDRVVSAQRRAMEHAVTKVLAEAASVEDAMPSLIRTMCDASGWSYGTLWHWSESDATLVRNACWSDIDMRFEPGEELPWTRLRYRNRGGLVGRAWFDGQTRWIEDMRRNTTFNRRHTALRFGLHSALSFPITAGGDTIGIVELFAREVRKPDDMLLQTLSSIGRQIGQFIQRKHAEQALRASEERYRDIYESSPLPMWVCDHETLQILTVNQAAVDHYGYSREEFMRMTVRDIWGSTAAPCEGDDARQQELQITHLRRKHVTKDGRTIDVEATARTFQLGGRKVWLTLLNDVTERLRAEHKLLHLAHYDVLTGLPNRVLFYDRLKSALVQAKRRGWITAVMFMDVDRFKNINDTLGHDIGDQLLRQVSERLTRSVRASDTIGRLGGDEFAIVLSNLSSREDAGLVAQKIMANFIEPFRLSGAEIFVTTSIGITLYPDDGIEQDVLVKNADAAMYRAKEEGRSTYRYYTPEMSARALKLLTLEGSLRRALERDEFLLHYQPKASVASGEITGIEALLRWRHPERGLVSPTEFIPVLEETGLIVQTSEWVLNAVCKQLIEWRRAGVRLVPIAVNLSARQFLARELGPTIKRILESHQISPALLELEITESSLMVNPQEAARTLEYLKSLGIGLSIDDFGTGYSSLSYLKRFPLDSLKIDRSFVNDITSNSNDAAITLAVISMAHSLGLKVVAEGVETAAQLEYLARHGCDQVQGYFLARPLPAEDCARTLQDNSRLHVPVEAEQASA